MSELWREGTIRTGVRTTVTQAADQPGAVIDFVSSDETLDRYGEVIAPEGWRLANYRRNPVFQNAHQCGDVLYTLGRALITEVRNGRLFQRIEFAVEANPVARIAYELYRGKFLNAVSVGFIPLRWENGGPNDPWVRRYVDQELVEVSAVGIPANPNALALALRDESRRDLLEALEAVKGMRAAAGPGKEWMDLASELRVILKAAA